MQRSSYALERMGLFGFDPESTFARVRSAPSAARVISLPQSMIAGALGFAAVSLAAYGVWAWGGRWLHTHVGELGLYTACAIVLASTRTKSVKMILFRRSGTLNMFFKLESTRVPLLGSGGLLVLVV